MLSSGHLIKYVNCINNENYSLELLNRSAAKNKIELSETGPSKVQRIL